MYYTDKVHLIAGDKTTLDELHNFAASIGLSKAYYHGFRKRHPHYDLTNVTVVNRCLVRGVKVISSKELLLMLKEKWPIKGTR